MNISPPKSAGNDPKTLCGSIGAARDKALEAAISALGREAVFSRAEALGWKRGQPAPKSFWERIVREMMGERHGGGEP